ncbi:Gp138 family membrane-puncturing spike protein [Gallibacterium anatis]|uniref:Gp138 family membrane-puncturing spike protein n=1 Tax=Gallibacterium anatis TaxID=750 RepID=UPI0026705873|nr:Gp138 family membrane-puncturing spike protein [Gallibacterium anatis]WKS98294.1 phage baseplate protein [Gallibacterium anatis]
MQNNNYGLMSVEEIFNGDGNFQILQLINRIQTVTLVLVKAVNATGANPVGTVDVQPMVAQLDGQGGIHEHGIIYNIPYFRLQGGKNAVIIDPQVGDIGMCGFCSRDISSVKNTKKPSSPQSRRKFDYADGLFFGGFLNGTPEQYIYFKNGGIDIISPDVITLQSSKVIIDAPVETTATIKSDGDMIAGNISLQNHTHPGDSGGTTGAAQ